MAYSFSDQDAQRVAEVYSKLNGGLDGDAHKLTRTDLQKTLEILVLVEQREDVNTFLDERTNLHRKNGEYTSMQILEYFGKDDFQTYFEWRKEQQASSI